MVPFRRVCDSLGHGEWPRALLRKEVIQPHVPVRLPCYDFIPVTNPAFGSSLQMNGWATDFGRYRLP